MKTLPSYLSPQPVPNGATVNAQKLRRLQQSTAAAAAVIGDVDSALSDWKSLKEDERKKAVSETDLDADSIEKLAAELAGAVPKSKPSNPDRSEKREHRKQKL